MKTIYLAGSMNSAERLRKEVSRLEWLGYNVVSQWYESDHSNQNREFQAMGDVYNLFESDIIIIDTIDPSTSGGRCVELGLALARELAGLDIHIIRIGPSDNIFFDLVRETYPTWEAFYDDETGGFGSCLDD